MKQAAIFVCASLVLFQLHAGVYAAPTANADAAPLSVEDIETIITAERAGNFAFVETAISATSDEILSFELQQGSAITVDDQLALMEDPTEIVYLTAS